MIEPGDIINNRYHVIKQLGKGSFSKTFEVEDKLIGDHKVIKILTLFDFGNSKILQLFEQEFNVLNNLNHPGIPKVEIDGYLRFLCTHTNEILHGLVMEKIEGHDLGEWLRQNKKNANETQAIDWLKQLIDILAHVHSQNYLHRDIKPDNIMLKPNGKLVLIDFCIVKDFIQRTQRQTNPSTMVGTPGYCSPEQEVGKDINYASDFFSLGRTFVHLLTGTFPGNFLETKNSKLLWRDKAPEISETFKDLIDDLMEDNPKRRPKNIADILQVIKKIEEKKQHDLLPAPIVFLSFALNLIFITLLATGLTLNIGWIVFFVVVVCVIGGFLFVSLI
ncbi:serine/threonine protein kinase [Sphaerospermopsis aphanizomenoides BCCUSP55]|uniref:serine/threonine protein kinase n=1 Tax=Sphaerospermopsis aphanizomenoides TaxID=459663 RepID=UPI001906F95C|nr:serine/threonine-protein kinase [Sphaerospermopsis aphanizomenoides]MBK1988069.1 serine/threonine protein kinase [Sphaerospermopsis aphanizomenoides BCCUSP55]